MAMNVGGGSEEGEVMVDINTTPLIDVMLVLLVMLIITIPIQLHSVNLEMPVGAPPTNQVKPENVIISVDTANNVYWYDRKIDNVEELVTKLKKVSKAEPQPEVQIRGDMAARYEGVGKILYACQRAGIVKVAFITEPPPLGG